MPQTPQPARYDFLNDTTSRRINYRIARLGRKYALSSQDRDDIRQEFYLALIRAADNYDPQQCLPERFVRMVLNRNYKHFVRKLARVNENRTRSVATVSLETSGPHALKSLIDHRNEEDRRRRELAEDVRAAIGRLPDDLRSLCHDLMTLSPLQVASKRGVHHSLIYRDMARLRAHFKKRGIFGVF